MLGRMRIVALSVFEGVVYHCYAADTAHPERPVLEVDARTQDGDLDAGPLLVSLAEFAAMAGHDATARALPHLREANRIVEWMGVQHVRFPLWTVR
jgi:hypothetical protein